MSNDFIERLQRGPMLCDGAMGTQLHAHGITFEHSLDGLNLTQPEVVLNVHRGYVEAGADLLETNTFGGNRFRLLEHDLEDKVAEINRSGVRLARKAADESRRQIYVAGSVGPLGVRLAPLGRVTAAEAFAAFKEQITALNEAGVDALIFETFSDLNEIVQAIKAAREVNANLPLIAQMTYTEDGCTPLGDTPEQVARKLCELEVDVIGANCSVGPAKLLPVVQALARHARASGLPPARVDSAQRRLAAAHGLALDLSGHARILRRFCAALPASGRVDHRRLLRHHARSHPRDADGAGRSGVAAIDHGGSARCDRGGRRRPIGCS